MNPRNYLILTALVFLFFSFYSCKQEMNKPESSQFVLPATPKFSDSSYWGVISEPYVKLYSRLGNKEEIETTCREGDIIEIQRRVLRDDEIWLFIIFENREGWTNSQRIMIFDNKEQARVASASK